MMKIFQLLLLKLKMTTRMNIQRQFRLPAQPKILQTKQLHKKLHHNKKTIPTNRLTTKTITKSEATKTMATVEKIKTVTVIIMPANRIFIILTGSYPAKVY